MDEGLLSTRRRFHHVVADQPENLADLDPRRRNPLQHRHRKRRVVAVAVQRGLAFLGREEHQRAAAGLDLSQSLCRSKALIKGTCAGLTARHGGGCDNSWRRWLPGLFEKWIVAA